MISKCHLWSRFGADVVLEFGVEERAGRHVKNISQVFTVNKSKPPYACLRHTQHRIDFHVGAHKFLVLSRGGYRGFFEVDIS